MDRQDNLYQMSIDKQTSFSDHLTNTPPSAQQLSTQTPLKMHFHPGFFCLFHGYLEEHKLSLGTCYQNIIKANRQINRISYSPQSIIKSDNVPLAKISLLQKNHVDPKDHYISYFIEDNQIKKDYLRYNFETNQNFQRLQNTIKNYKKMNQQLIVEKKKQFERRRQQQKKKLQQQMKEKQEWERRMQETQKQIILKRQKIKQQDQLRKKKQKEKIQQQARMQLLRKQQQARIEAQRIRQKEQRQKLSNEQYKYKEKVINWIITNKKRQAKQQVLSQQILKDNDFQKQLESHYKNNQYENYKFQKSQSRQINCQIM